MLRLPVRTISKGRARVAAVVAPTVFKSTLIGQFFRFGTVGTSGFLIDTAIVYGLKGKLGLYAAGMMSYLVVASWCWALNRCWTFRGHGSGPSHHQWARYLLMNLLGLVINRGTYAALGDRDPIVRHTARLCNGRWGARRHDVELRPSTTDGFSLALRQPWPLRHISNGRGHRHRVTAEDSRRRGHSPRHDLQQRNGGIAAQIMAVAGKYPVIPVKGRRRLSTLYLSY